MSTIKRMSVALLLVCGLLIAGHPALGQQGGDEVDQLDQIVNLSDDQKTKIRTLIADSEAKTNKLRAEAQQLQQALGQEVGPDYNEGNIRKNAKKLGKVSGDLTAESVLLQARIQEALTEEQRATLEARIQQMRELQQQMQQQQQGGGQQ